LYSHDAQLRNVSHAFLFKNRTAFPVFKKTDSFLVKGVLRQHFTEKLVIQQNKMIKYFKKLKESSLNKIVIYDAKKAF